MKKTDQTDNQTTAEERVESKLLANSTHFLIGEIAEENIAKCIKWITYENLIATPRTLTLYINSPGGDLYQAFALIDVMNTSHHPIRVVGIGSIMSAAFLIFCAGTKGKRTIGENTGIMCHQYSDSPEGKHHDLKSQMKEGDECNARMMRILRQATDLPATKIRSKLLKETNVYLTAQEAIDLGIADDILSY